MLERPHTPLVKTIDNKTQMLKIMSIDLASIMRPKNKSNLNYISVSKSADIDLKSNQINVYRKDSTSQLW